MKTIIYKVYQLEDSGSIPNSSLPVILYNFITPVDVNIPDYLELLFAQNCWSNTFRWRVYDYHHYHSNTHEVLAVCKGTAKLQIGGPLGPQVDVGIGDVLILPAGTGHASLHHTENFEVLGAYPNGAKPDLITFSDPRPENIRKKINQVQIPFLDPLYGDAVQSGIQLWKTI